MNSVNVFVDTSVLWSGSGINERSLRELASMATLGQIRVWIPEVVVLEMARHASNAELRYRKELARFNSLVEVCGTSRPSDPPAANNWDEAVRTRLTKLGSIAQLPAVPHSDVVARDLSQIRPFQANGKGYRDTLIWETLLEGPRDVTTILLTANKNDFGNGLPHSDLGRDIEDGRKILVLEDVSALTKWLADPKIDRTISDGKNLFDSPLPLSTISAAVETWPTLEVEGVRFGRRLSPSANVDELYVSSIRDGTDFMNDDEYGQIEVDLEADAELSAEMNRSLLSHLDDDVRIFEVESGQEQVSISASRPIVVKVAISYRLDTMDIIEARIESAWPA